MTKTWRAVTLTPGWCCGHLRSLDHRRLQLLLAKPSHTPITLFPPHTRLGILQRIHRAQPLPTPPSISAPHTEPWIALVSQSVSAWELLGLSQRGLAGMIFLRASPARHTLVTARALGIPTASADTAPAQPFTTPFVLDARHTNAGLSKLDTRSFPQPPTTAARSLPSLPTPLLGSPNLTRVVPLPFFSTTCDTPQALELISAQPEERHLAKQLLSRAPQSRGIGLIRLEFLCYADPLMDAEDLEDVALTIAQDLSQCSIAFRLADWSQEKPPSAPTELQAWNGQRGIAGLCQTPALALQIQALGRAALRAPQPSFQLIVPLAQEPQHLLAVQKLAEPFPLNIGAMLETPLALSQAHLLTPHAPHLWLGLGDLHTCAKEPHQFTRALEQAAQLALHYPLWVCGL